MKAQYCRASTLSLLVFWVLSSNVARGSEEGLIGHWLFDQSHILGQGLPDLADKSLTTIDGPVRFERFGSWETLRLDESTSIHLNGKKNVRVPTRNMTAETWIRIDRPLDWGGIVGIIQDNGAEEKGWLLGFRERKLSFALKGKEGAPLLTYLTAPQPFKRRQWYHVAGTYDGAEQRLYVDGKLVASARDQQGDILYPTNAFYHIGAYRDENEFYRMVGAVHEIRVYERALSSEEIRQHFQAKADSRPELSSLRVSGVFSSNMVLQRDQKLPIWGWSKPGEEVSVKLGSDTMTAVSNSAGAWKVMLPPQRVGEPIQLTVTGRTDQLSFDNILVGDVWICSGQSNMQWPVQSSANAAQEIAAADFPQIRLFTVNNVIEPAPAPDCDGLWQVCRPETVAGFSAVAYYFGRHLHRELKVPIGLINASWGGSLCEAWMSREALEADPDYATIVKQSHANPWFGSGLYNGMIHPLVSFGIRGVIWYQGEANILRAEQYRRLFPTLIGDWRGQWGQGDFPFYYVQLCPFRADPNQWAELWDAQRQSMSVPNTGMVVTTDVGELRNIHPRNKQEVGRRLALWALSKTYDRKLVVPSGPLYKSMKIEGNEIRIEFNYGHGLSSRDDQPLTWFTIAGPDHNFHPAKASIDNDAITVHSEKVTQPLAVRFGWSSVAQPNLVNANGLPASPFRTDDWPLTTLSKP